MSGWAQLEVPAGPALSCVLWVPTGIPMLRLRGHLDLVPSHLRDSGTWRRQAGLRAPPRLASTGTQSLRFLRKSEQRLQLQGEVGRARGKTYLAAEGLGLGRVPPSPLFSLLFLSTWVSGHLLGPTSPVLNACVAPPGGDRDKPATHPSIPPPPPAVKLPDQALCWPPEALSRASLRAGLNHSRKPTPRLTFTNSRLH